MKERISVIILTYNEEIHLKRCIQSVENISNQIIIVDSFSNDNTLNIASQFKCEIYQNHFINQAVQFQWALDNISIKGNWILRLDADELLTNNLCEEIKNKIDTIEKNVTGIYLNRQVHFLGKWIRYGGYYPIKLLRLWRNGAASIEQKWMDEHVILNYGDSMEFENDFIDNNLNNLSWWTLKHNNYSNREVVEYFNEKYCIISSNSIDIGGRTQEVKKRKYKSRYYNKAPLFLRAFLYFLYRYFIKLGFLDGKKGLIWHFLQGFWYRFLVDAKIYQIEKLAKDSNNSIKECLEKEYDFKF